MEGGCPILCMLSINTLRKVMTQLPLAAKGVNNIEAIKGTNFYQAVYTRLQCIENACCKVRRCGRGVL